MRRAVVSAAVALGLVFSVAATGRRVEDPGVRVVRAMHDRYAKQWYHTMTFVQTTTRRLKDGRDTISTWYESVRIPGLLRIDFGPPSDGNGILFTPDSTFRVTRDSIVRRGGGNELLLMLFDVYSDPVDQTVATLRARHVDLSKVRDTVWMGRPVSVVGADAGDGRAPQLWVDKERLVLLRQINPLGDNDARLLDVRLNEYRPIGKGWIAPKVEILIDGNVAQREDYGEIKVDVPLDPDLFDLTKWSSAHHWAH